MIFPPLLQVWWPGPSLQSRPPASGRQLAARLSVVGGREGGTTLASWQEAHWRIVRHVVRLTDRKLSCKKKRYSNCLLVWNLKVINSGRKTHLYRLEGKNKEEEKTFRQEDCCIFH